MHYVAIVEESEGQATGVWFPDLPGCFAAGDTTDEAVANAIDAVAHYAEALAETGRHLPPARPLSELRRSPDLRHGVGERLFLLVPAPSLMVSSAAE